MSAIDHERIREDFSRLVNMGAGELESWLATEESCAVGWKGAEARTSESVGHASGRRILEILRSDKGTLSAADYEHMRTVIGFIRRHRAQRPDNIYTSRWRYSLMNWGHDPTKEDQSEGLL